MIQHSDEVPRSARSAWVELALVAVVMLVALAFLHPALLVEGKIYTSSDMQSAAVFKHLGDAARQQGEYPLWNPFVFMGMPSYASLAYTPDVYPLTAPLRWLTGTLGLPPMTWMLFHLFIMGVTLAAYLRWRGVALVAAMMAGALLMAMPNVVSWSVYGHGTKLGTLAWMPLALWCIEGVLRRGRWVYVFGLAFAVGMQLLRSHVQIAYYTVIAMFLWAMFFGVPLLREHRARALRRVAMIAVAAVLALGASMVLYMPVLEYQSHSIRAAGSGAGTSEQGRSAAYDYATNWSLSPSEVETFWWPTAVGYGKSSYVGGMPFTDFPNYVGLPVLLLALLAVVLRRDRWSYCLASLALLATAVSMGKHSFVYDLFYQLLPGFSKFRVPVMILALQQFALVALAAAGLDRLVATVNDEDRPVWFSSPLLIGVGLVGAGFLAAGTVFGSSLVDGSLAKWTGMRGTVPAVVMIPVAEMAKADAVRVGCIILVGSGLVAAWGQRRVPALALTAAVALLTFFDYHRVSDGIIHPDQHLVAPVQQGGRIVTAPYGSLIRDESAVREFVAGNDVTEWIRSQGERSRVWPLGQEGSSTNLFAGQEIVSLGGYHAAKLKLFEDLRSRIYTERPSVGLVNLLAVEYVSAPSEFDVGTLTGLAQTGLDLGQAPVFRGGDGVVYRNHTAQPRAWVVGRIEQERMGHDTTSQRPDESVLTRVAAPGFDLRSTAILSASPQPAPASGTRGSARVVDEGYNWVEVEADLTQPGVLVMADIYYPGWAVTVNGRPADLLRANYALRAVALDAGQHAVRFEFRSDSFQRGRSISVASGAIIGLGLLASLLGALFRRSGSEGKVT